ncbi:hypothetical protein [Elizabethkingia anophelis]|uniref:hypothetical protein n=1 Tax=Elizabethkingia anophelis TaxID=1117645 RepID=UPI0038927C4E
MTKKVLILPMLLISIVGFSQYSISEISKDAYLKDFDIAVDIIKKQHPNPYRFHSKEVLGKKLDSLRKEIEKNPTYIGFYMNTPTKVLGDGHSSMGMESNYMEDYVSINFLFSFGNLCSKRQYVYQQQQQIRCRSRKPHTGGK